MNLSIEQQHLLERSISSKIFLQGRAGTGKTTAGTYWLKKLLKSGIRAHEILVMVPQRALAKPYLDALVSNDIPVHSLITTMTLGSLARRMVDLFWPMISRETGVNHPELPPHYLTLETSQYYMAHIVRPLIEEEGFFSSLTVNRNRIYSQILDNLNKAAIVGFPYEEIGDRLKSAWVGDLEQMNIYDDVQLCANAFRHFCIENNLLDFSLQVEIFLKHLWRSPLCRQYLVKNFRHLIVDNIEEDAPVSHDILREWLPEFDSALLIYDEDAGYRFFLGADTKSAFDLRHSCQEIFVFTENLTNTPNVARVKNGVENALAQLHGNSRYLQGPSADDISSALGRPEENPKYFPEMVQWVSDKIKSLVEGGTAPGEIVILAPFMPDILRFSLANQLTSLGIPNQAHRPSRSLREEPATQTLLTLAEMVFTQWTLQPKRIDVQYALMQVIDDLDLVRSQLLCQFVYKETSQGFELKPFTAVPLEYRERISNRVGKRYDRLRDWLERAHQGGEQFLDFFLNRLFGEVLSQPGFGYHNDLDSGNIIANLVESIQKFRWAVGEKIGTDPVAIGKEYVQMVQDGVIAAQYLNPWEDTNDSAVFLSPAYTFLISNRPVDIQFWLDVGSPSWYQRLDQPLTHPYVLNRHWEKGELWDAEDELNAAYDTLQRLTLGLLNRCRRKIFLGMSELDVRGYENRGLLIRIIQNVLRQAHQWES